MSTKRSYEVRYTLRRSDMSTPEGKIQLDILKHLRQRNVLCWRNQTQGIRDKTTGAYYSNPYVMRGCPDILGVMPDGSGRILGIEVKTPKGRQSADQILFERRLQRAGGVYVLARSVDDVQCVFDGSV